MQESNLRTLPTCPTSVTLVSGGSYQQRESAIAAAVQKMQVLAGIHSANSVAVILEGLPSGELALQVINDRLSDPATAPQTKLKPTLQIQRIAPGCMCCIGNLAMRVTLNRLLRQKPNYLFLALGNPEHLTQLRDFLSQAPYVDLLRFDADIILSSGW